MRFVRVAVRNFQALESADVEFAPGLNVVFGPNDLGKSTLAAAIRAALLVSPSSAEAASYRPWFIDATPEVNLTFQDDEDRYWQVRKRFAAGGRSSADLYHSKDGVTFASEYQAREVEDQLRKLLAWGIPSPGGKGAPRKVASFLSHVLLAEQTEVETIFGQSLANDGGASGKNRLQKALAALAEDPLFKTILGEVQRKVNEYFSAGGQRRRGRESPFVLAAETVNRRAERVGELKAGVNRSADAEALVGRLRGAYASAHDLYREASIAVSDARQQQARAKELESIEQNLTAARDAVAALDRQAQEVLEAERAVIELDAKVEAAERAAAEAQRELEEADAALREAEESVRAATGEERVRQRELARARLEAEQAKLTTQIAEAEKRHEALEAAKKATESAEATAAAQSAAEAAVERAVAAEAGAKTRFNTADEEVELARRLISYGQWHEANEAAKQAEEASSRAETLRAEITTREKRAHDLETQAEQKRAEATALREALPAPALIAELEKLSQELALAEAALGGGLSIAIRGSGKVPLHLALDGREAIAGIAIDGRVVLEAERVAVLSAGDLLDIEITAGAADKRATVDALRGRWAEEAQPVLTRSGLAGLSEIRERFLATEDLAKAAETLATDAKQLRTEAQAARQNLELQEQRIAELLPRAADATSLEAKLAGVDVSLLASGFAKLGPAWKLQAVALADNKERALAQAREHLAQATRDRDTATIRAGDAAQRAADAWADATRSRGALNLTDAPGTPDPVATATTRNAAELAAFLAQRTETDEKLRALTLEDASAATATQQALEAAHSSRETREALGEQKQQELNDVRSSRDKARGSAETLRSALEACDRAAAEARLVAASTAFEPYAGDAPVPPNALQTAEQREVDARNSLDGTRRELDQAEGALSGVGGDPLKEELLREEEALALAKNQVRDLELDADSWSLLRDTLQEAEKDGTSHLGRSLAGPVSARLVELTGARYSNLRLDQHLQVEGVDVASVANVEDVLAALSVGTRDQIATLLRLTIAEQLRHAVILDDHLVHADPERLEWFRNALSEAAKKTQVVVITCRAADYLDAGTVMAAEAAVRAIDLARIAKRFAVSVGRSV
jgi:hypothetical protein